MLANGNLTFLDDATDFSYIIINMYVVTEIHF